MNGKGLLKRAARCSVHPLAIAVLLAACSSQSGVRADTANGAEGDGVATTAPGTGSKTTVPGLPGTGSAGGTTAVGTSPGSTAPTSSTLATTPASSTPSSTTATSSASAPEAPVLPPASIPVAVTSFAAPPASCQPGPAEQDGTVTFVVGGQLLSVHPDGSELRCLFAVTADESGRIAWSSAGDRVLLGPATVADTTGARPSGYFASNTKVAWSTPSGKALIAPKANTGQLVWRSSTDQGKRLDVSFMRRTDFAAYHPSGKAIAATGLGLDGVPGVYIATNRGKSPKLLARLETPNSELTELGFSMTGNVLYFLHHHDDTGHYHVHRLQLANLDLSDLVEEPGSASHLTVSTVDEETVAWQVAEPGTPSRVKVSVHSAAPAVVDVGAGVDVEPMGWLSATRLVVRSVPAGSAGGTAGDLWIWSPAAAPVHLVGGVSRAAVRIPQGAYQDPVDAGEAQAPG